MDELWVAVGNYGFPMILSIYLLMRLEKRMEKLDDSIVSLSTTIIELRNSGN